MGHNFPFCLMIWTAEVLGAILGVLFVLISQEKDDMWLTIHPGIALLCPNVATSQSVLDSNVICSVEKNAGNLFFVEALVTFIFVNVILTVKYHFGANDHVVNAATVGVTLFTAITLSGSISGGCVNPAVGLV